MARRSLALLLMCLGALFVVPVLAQADTGNIVEPQNEQTPVDRRRSRREPATAGQNRQVTARPKRRNMFFTQAGGHPPIGFTQYIIQARSRSSAAASLDAARSGSRRRSAYEDRTIKTLRVDLPPGLTVNPQATAKCSTSRLRNKVETEPANSSQVPNCPKGSIVGREEVTLVVNTANAVPAPSPPFPPGTSCPKGS